MSEEINSNLYNASGNTQLITLVLENVYEDECLIVGETAIKKLVETNSPVAYIPQGGSDFDYATLITELSAGLTVIKLVLEIWEKGKVIKQSLLEKSKIELDKKNTKVEPEKLISVVNFVSSLSELPI